MSSHENQFDVSPRRRLLLHPLKGEWLRHSMLSFITLVTWWVENAVGWIQWDRLCVSTPQFWVTTMTLVALGRDA